MIIEFATLDDLERIYRAMTTASDGVPLGAPPGVDVDEGQAFSPPQR
jgi:hypothetical protein